MSTYVVNWQRADGQPGWHPAATVQEASTHVEHLRNHEGVDGARIFRLDEVAFEYKPWYRVELASEPVVPTSSFAASIAPDLEVDDHDLDDTVNGTVRRGLFGR